MTGFTQKTHNTDFCVIGGGMAGLGAAIAAARKGIKVVLMHDRPVFGGNASSECRVHIGGADRHNKKKNLRETGILEELRLENLYRNPNRNFSIWDTILYEKVLAEPNITMLLNCSCLEAGMKGDKIENVTGWQLTTQMYHKVNARIFADCSGDAILAPLTGAQCRQGREARAEYDESIAPSEADSRTMGMTCLFQSMEYSEPQPFEPPQWAHCYDSCDDLPYGVRGHRWWQMGYWWIELGGESDSIHDTEKLRDEILKITYGVWDHIKNRCPNRDEARNWAIEWIQFLPAKRESRRYIGAHVMTQNDIESKGRFEDTVAYGGWSMDDHHPAGFKAVKLGVPATIFHEAPSPYGIPFRSLYSRNVSNLMFAGRDASCTHAAMSSTRVMGTCCAMGQAVGAAAALLVANGRMPSEMSGDIKVLQQALLRDDAYLPGVKQVFSPEVTCSALTCSCGNPEPVRNGINRPVGDETNCWKCRAGDWIAYQFESQLQIESITAIVDSGLDQNIVLSHHRNDDQLTSPPDVMPRSFRIEGLIDAQWQVLVSVEQNHQRFCRFPINRSLLGIRFVLEKNWAAEYARVYAFYFNS